MNLFQWKKEYEIGLSKIDAQHRTLVDMLNKLYAAKKSDQAQQVVEEILDELLQYTKTHFSDEEAAMREANYPDLDKHRYEHIDLTDQVIMLHGDDPVTFELLNFLNEWLKVHLSGSDQEFGIFMRAQQMAKTVSP